MSRHPTARQGTKMLGRYRIEKELGRGGMGVVYVATDENTGRLVALKTTSVAGLGSGEKSRNQRRERFIREVRALTQVNHENVVHVFDAGECDDADLGWLLFYTMEYVEGTTLASLVQERGALGGGEAAAVVMQVAAGLGEAHAQGIIHRDVKPANIFLSVDGRVKIGDFGIAKIEGSTQITRRDQLVGTPNYLAPEQILGDPVGPQTDVFALGALFFVITQNKPLRQQVDASALLVSANGNDPVQRMLGVQNLSEGLKRAVARSLERDPVRRYVDGAAFADALAEHATRVPALQGSAAPPPSFLTEGTSDRSSAFINSASNPASMPEANALDIHSLPDAPMPDMSAGDASGIDALAAAMLADVERRATGTFKQPQREKDPADVLPVAQTESTVMFNLRAMEEEHSQKRQAAPPPPPSSSAALPVARAEPTSMFSIDENGMPVAPKEPPKKAKPAVDLEPVLDDPGWEDRTREAPAPAPAHAEPSGPQRRDILNAPTLLNDPSDEQPPVSAEGPNVPTATAPTSTTTGTHSRPALPFKLPFPLPPRNVLLAASFVGGLLIGLIFAALLAPSQPAAKDGVPPIDLDVAPMQSRPTMCPAREVSDTEKAQAAAELDEARTLKRQGASSSKVVERLKNGIARDPSNYGLFYELGRVVTGPEQDDADECVCQIAPDSKECATVEKARGR